MKDNRDTTPFPRYVVFGGSYYYPSQGWNDMIATTMTRIDAFASIAGMDLDWWHIVDLSSNKIVEQGHADWGPGNDTVYEVSP